MGKIDWLAEFFENQKGIKCTACSDCDRERDAAERRIRELEDMIIIITLSRTFDPHGDLVREYADQILRNRARNTEQDELPPETQNPSTD